MSGTNEIASVAQARELNQERGAAFWRQTIEAGQQVQASQQVRQEAREEATQKPRQMKQ